MRYKGEIYNFIEQRNHELFLAYKKVVGSGDVLSNAEYFQKIVNMPTSRFFVDLQNTVNVIRGMLAGKTKFSIKTKQEMYDEIFRRTMRMQQRLPGKSLYKVVERVIRQPAPKFYMSPGSAEVIICQLRKEKRKLWRK